MAISGPVAFFYAVQFYCALTTPSNPPLRRRPSRIYRSRSSYVASQFRFPGSSFNSTSERTGRFKNYLDSVIHDLVFATF